MIRLPRHLWLALVAVAVAALAATAAEAATLAGFGRCLKSKGATFYGTSWCPHCDAQREALGDAMNSVRYVECSVDGARGESTPACRKAKIDSYPTWTFSDGSRAGGAQSLEELAAKTGCDLPRGAER